MIDTKDFYRCLVDNHISFFTGVPDSLLKELCLCIKYETDIDRHIIAANEGNAVAIACGYNIATSEFGAVYMQNSGIGNAVNPLLSLADEKVYKIPMLLIIGYRGEPNVKDEPQHITQGALTLPILETLGIEYRILNEDYKNQIKYCCKYMKEKGRPIALIVRKNTFSKYGKELDNNNKNPLTRERALEIILQKTDDNDMIVSTTGKTSREIYEIRDKYDMSHSNDFLTVGSMGHTSSLAFGISLFSDKNIFCIDGDGSFIMHMGGLASAVQRCGENFKYILINNGCHQSVGGQPTIANDLDIKKILLGFGFNKVLQVREENALCSMFESLKSGNKTAMIINTNEESREDLGRPKTSPIENKEKFQTKLRGKI